MSGAQTTKRREGELTGPRQAKCIVTITKRGSVETLAINDVEPRGIADGNYTLTVKGEPDDALEAGPRRLEAPRLTALSR